MHSWCNRGIVSVFPYASCLSDAGGARVVQFGFPQTQVIEPCFAVLETVFFTPGTYGDVVTVYSTASPCPSSVR